MNKSIVPIIIKVGKQNIQAYSKARETILPINEIIVAEGQNAQLGTVNTHSCCPCVHN